MPIIEEKDEPLSKFIMQTQFLRLFLGTHIISQVAVQEDIKMSLELRQKLVIVQQVNNQRCTSSKIITIIPQFKINPQVKKKKQKTTQSKSLNSTDWIKIYSSRTIYNW
jgi:hypothetical protein